MAIPVESALRVIGTVPEASAVASDFEEVKSIRQQQQRFTNEDAVQVAEKYQAGATVDELAIEFGCHRNTVSIREAYGSPCGAWAHKGAHNWY